MEMSRIGKGFGQSLGKTMKAITVWQSWAGALAAGIKENETRSCNRRGTADPRNVTRGHFFEIKEGVKAWNQQTGPTLWRGYARGKTC